MALQSDGSNIVAGGDNLGVPNTPEFHPLLMRFSGTASRLREQKPRRYGRDLRDDAYVKRSATMASDESFYESNVTAAGTAATSAQGLGGNDNAMQLDE